MSRPGEHITRRDAFALTQGDDYASRHQNTEYFAQLKALRKEAQAEIDRLLAFLDDLDGDPDLEHGEDDEPSLGFSHIGIGVTSDSSGGDDREVDDCDREDNGDGEPSLGSLACDATPYSISVYGGRDVSGSQEHWAAGNCRDLEEEVGKDGREGDADDDDGYMASRRYQNRLRKRRGQRALQSRREART